MENNRVKVKIYGQEYVISGEKSKEEIIKVAALVDMKMQEVVEAAKAAGVSYEDLVESLVMEPRKEQVH